MRESSRFRISIESQSEVPLTDKTGKVTSLITAESIIAGFMIAYGALNGQMLIYWSEPRHHGSLVTTYIVGVGIYAIVITCLASILLLYWSLDTNEMDDVRYKAGYGLFIWAIFLSCVFVNVAVWSIYHFTTATDHKPYDVPVTPWTTVSVIGFYGYVVFLIYVGALAILTHSKEVRHH